MFNNLTIGSNEHLQEVLGAIKSAGITWATGVPCGELRHFIHAFNTDQGFTHIPALNEREAVGIAAGVWLAGELPIVHMQNSGLFVASNDIASVWLPCKMGIPMIVSYRGCPGENAPQHLHTGANTKALLNGLKMPHLELEEGDVHPIQLPLCLIRDCRETNLPSAILVKRGWTSFPAESATASPERNGIFPKPAGVVEDWSSFYQLKKQLPLPEREEILNIVHAATPADAAIISSTGLISRSLFDRHDSPNQFYNAGGFGVTSAIGLGFAMVRPDTKTVVVEGDASCLANIGNLISIAHFAPRNFIHIIVDNEAYGSCSEEPSLSQIGKFASTAANFGYRRAYLVDTAEMLAGAMQEALVKEGPTLVQVKIRLGGRRNFARPLAMAEIAQRFRSHFEN